MDFFPFLIMYFQKRLLHWSVRSTSVASATITERMKPGILITSLYRGFEGWWWRGGWQGISPGWRGSSPRLTVPQMAANSARCGIAQGNRRKNGIGGIAKSYEFIPS